MPEISEPTKKLITKYQAWYQSQQKTERETVIHVDEVASSVAAFYEKIRGVVDWREEHLMRRAAIERILKRRLLLIKDSKTIAEPLVLELIRGGHFPNDRLPVSKVLAVQKSLDKYIFILENSAHAPGQKQKVQLYDWLLSIAACEIEEILSPPQREKALIDYMMESMADRIKVQEGILVLGGMTQEEKNTQVYIAIQRALLKLDNSIIAFNLLKRKYPQWQDLTREQNQLQEISQNIYSIWNELEKDLTHKLSERFYKICERYDTPYLILGDIVSENPLEVAEKIKTPEELENRVRIAYEKRLRTLKSRLRRAAFYATLSIFITKIFLALAVEFQFDKYLSTKLVFPEYYYTLGWNILIPPLLMFFLILTIRPPKKENLQKVVIEVVKIAYPHEKQDSYTVVPPRKRGIVMNFIITLFYLLSFFVSFGLIIFGLQKLNFSILSIAIFLLFISLISFAGVKIRERSRELEVSERKDSFFVFFIDLFSLPIIQVGRWLSAQWARYNIIVIIFNFLIDMPFQIFVEFLEQLTSFLKEKKEEIH